jgi:hypothetical protein
MLDNFDYFRTIKFDKLKERTRKGIPEGMRGLAWMKIAGVKDYKNANPTLYKELLNKMNSPSFIDQTEEEVIIRDLHRTFPKSMIFNPKLGEGQRALYRILMCFSSYYRETGYVQGMGFLAALFLSYMDEESSFWMLYIIFKKYNLEEIYKKDFPGLKKRLYIFLKLVEKFMPKIYKKLIEKEVHPTMYASQWFFTCFTNCFPFELVVRIFDCYLLEGEKIIYRIALAIIKSKEAELLKAKHFESLMEHLKNATSEIKDPGQLLDTAFNFSFSRNHINNYEQQYQKALANKDKELIKMLGY